MMIISIQCALQATASFANLNMLVQVAGRWLWKILHKGDIANHAKDMDVLACWNWNITLDAHLITVHASILLADFSELNRPVMHK